VDNLISDVGSRRIEFSGDRLFYIRDNKSKIDEQIEVVPLEEVQVQFGISNRNGCCTKYTSK